jgi:hypothetical protein
MKSLPTNYQSYLLRIWQEHEYGTWRASLTNISTRECHAFSNLAVLYSYLHEQTNSHAKLNQFTEYQTESTGFPVFMESSDEEK